MNTIYYKGLKSKKLETRNNLKPGSWVNIVNPKIEELEKIEEKLGIDSDLLEDALDPFEVPRLEDYNNKLYIFTRCPMNQGGEIVTIPLLIILSDEHVVTVCTKKLPILQKFTNGTVQFATTQKIKLILQIFHEVHAEYHKYITEINKKIRSNRIKLEKITNKDILQLIRYEETVNEFITDLMPTGVILTNILSGHLIKLYEDDRDLVEDLLLSNNELLKLSRSKLKSLVNIRDAYSTIMTNNLNRVIRVLTSLTVILMVPTIITGLYGMNVSLPYAQSPLAFFGIIGITTGISIALLLLFMKNRWF